MSPRETMLPPTVLHAVPSLRPNILLMEDWHEMMRAVKSRLEASVHALAATEHDAHDDVLSCVAALDQLQVSLQYELARRQRLEEGLRATQAALEHTRAQLG